MVNPWDFFNCSLLSIYGKSWHPLSNNVRHPHPLDNDDDVPSAPRHQSRPHPHPDDNAPSPSPSPSTTTTTCSRHHPHPCPLPDSNATLALILSTTITTCLCHHPRPLPLDNDDEDDVARLRPNRVHSSTTARLLLPPDPFEPSRLPSTQPCQFERDCLCLTSTAPSRARSLFSNPTMSIRAQLLVFRIHQALLSAAACLPPNRVNLSTTARVLPSTRPFQA